MLRPRCISGTMRTCAGPQVRLRKGGMHFKDEFRKYPKHVFIIMSFSSLKNKQFLIKSMDVDGRRWTSMDVRRWTSMDVDGRRWTSMDVDGRRWTSKDVDGCRWTSMDVDDHCSVKNGNDP